MAKCRGLNARLELVVWEGQLLAIPGAMGSVACPVVGIPISPAIHCDSIYPQRSMWAQMA